jgi:hypothetical protein
MFILYGGAVAPSRLKGSFDIVDNGLGTLTLGVLF